MNKGVKTTTVSPAPYFAPLLCTIKLINPYKSIFTNFLS